MNKYIFPGADASTPLGWFVDKLEGAGFEIKSIDTIGGQYLSPRIVIEAWLMNLYSSLQRYSLEVVQKLDGKPREG